jgi:hypothetical protein
MPVALGWKHWRTSATFACLVSACSAGAAVALMLLGEGVVKSSLFVVGAAWRHRGRGEAARRSLELG